MFIKKERLKVNLYVEHFWEKYSDNKLYEHLSAAVLNFWS